MNKLEQFLTLLNNCSAIVIDNTYNIDSHTIYKNDGIVFIYTDNEGQIFEWYFCNEDIENAQIESTSWIIKEEGQENRTIQFYKLNPLVIDKLGTINMVIEVA